MGELLIALKVNEDGTISTQDSGYYRNGDLLGNNLGISPEYLCMCGADCEGKQGYMPIPFRR